MNKNRKLNLQLFAAGENNNMPARSYQKDFKELLQVVFKKQAYFADFFGVGRPSLMPRASCAQIVSGRM